MSVLSRVDAGRRGHTRVTVPTDLVIRGSA